MMVKGIVLNLNLVLRMNITLLNPNVVYAFLDMSESAESVQKLNANNINLGTG